MQIRVDKETVIDTDDLSLDQLAALLSQMNLEIDKIDYRIREVAALKNTTGEMADPQWFNRAQYARKRKRAAVQEITRELGQRRRGLRHVSEYFVDLCRELMEPAVFEKMIAAAAQRRDAALSRTATPET